MSKAIPPVQKFMTYQPQTINIDQTLQHAQSVMRDLKIRHLPVLKGGKLVGMLTDRDIKLVLSFEHPDAVNLKVGEACSEEPYTTSPNAPLNDVVTHMAEKKYGSAIVMDNDKVVGIFTDVDAMRALAELLQTRLGH
jgi:acetoin utilization protein AcuB